MTPLVSVAITTFNLEPWLPRALDSVFTQITDFPFEIVISDDASTDDTLQVARVYQERYPDVIRVLERSKNAGMCRNYYDAFEQCRGKFIGWLDAMITGPIRGSLRFRLRLWNRMRRSQHVVTLFDGFRAMAK